MLVLLFLIWSNAFTTIRLLREIFQPMELVLLRFLPVSIYCIIFLAVSSSRRKDVSEAIRSHPLQMLLMGIAGVAGYNIFLYMGQGEIKPGAAALLTTLSPIFTLILAIILIREKVPWRRALGIFIAFIGLYYVVGWGKVGMGKVTDIAHAEIKYALITSLAPLSWSFYTIIGKSVLKKHSPVVVTYLTIIIGTMPFLPFLTSGFFEKVQSMQLIHWIALTHLSIMCTIIGFLIWFSALKQLPATTVSSFVYLNPPFATFFGWLFFKEEVTIHFVLGSAVVLTGLYLAQNTGKTN